MTIAPRPVVAMGVSASGKSSFGKALADALGWLFVEGDELHPAANIAKMKASVPLDDADRAPWLDAVAAALAGTEGGIVASCSALKRAYRDRLRAAAPDTVFVLLDANPATLAARLRHRPGHFMPPELLASQLATLERPGADEKALILDATGAIYDNRDAALAWLALLSST